MLNTFFKNSPTNNKYMFQLKDAQRHIQTVDAKANLEICLSRKIKMGSEMTPAVHMCAQIYPN